MRNSVKATVDAYDGTVKLYQFDDQDPVLKAWNKAFGGHLIIPKAQTRRRTSRRTSATREDLFKVQRNLLAKFHVTQARRLLQRPGLLAGPERAGPAGRPGQTAAVLPERAAAGPGHHEVPADLGGDPEQPGQPGCADLRLVREQPAEARSARATRSDRGAGPGPGPSTHGRQRVGADRAEPVVQQQPIPGAVRQSDLAAGARRDAVRRAGVREDATSRMPCRSCRRC